MASKRGTAGWSDIPADLLWKVSQRLFLGDYIRLSAVCFSWRAVVSDRGRPPTAQSPWLILPGEDSTNFFSQQENKKCAIKIPEAMGSLRQKIIGSSKRCLISVDEDSVDKVLAIHILDPLSGTHNRLPSITTLPYLLRVFRSNKGQILDYLTGLGVHNRCRIGPNIMHHEIFAKVVVSESPSHPGRFMVAAFNSVNKLVYATDRDRSWNSLNIPSYDKNHLSDIIFYRNHLYMVRRSGYVEAYNLRKDTPILTFNLCSPGHPPSDLNLKYLVESCDGNLLQIWRQMEHCPESGVAQTVLVRVFLLNDLLIDNRRRDIGSKTEINKCWVELKTLGNQALFFGHNHSVALPDQGIPELRRNFIYFTDNRHLYWEFSGSLAYDSFCDVVVYDMESRTFVPYIQHEYQLGPPPLWYIPKFIANQARQQQ